MITEGSWLIHRQSGGKCKVVAITGTICIIEWPGGRRYKLGVSRLKRFYRLAP